MKRSFQDILKKRKEYLLKDVQFAEIKKTTLYGSCISNYKTNEIVFQIILSSLIDIYIFLHEGSILKNSLDHRLQHCLLHCIYYLGFEKNVKDLTTTIGNLRPKEIKLNVEGIKEYYISTLKLIFQFPSITIVETLISILCTLDYLFSTEQD